MKKTLLSLSLLLATVLIGFSQHTQTATGFTNTCEEVGTLGTDGFNFSLTPTDGGWNNILVDTLTFGYYVAASGTMYAFMDLNTPVDLSSPNNQLKFDMAVNGAGGVDTTQTITVKLEAGSPGSNTTVSNEETLNLSQVYSTQNPTFTAVGGEDLTAVTRITFTIPNAAASSRVAILYITKLSAGSSIVSSTKAASALVSGTKLYPNPVSDMATIELNLKAASDVKVTLSDMMGKEIMTIAEGSYYSLSKSFSVASLNQGIYNVNYYVNGAAAKSEMLLVK